MSNYIPTDHPLAAYHRRDLNIGDLSHEELFRQWGQATLEGPNIFVAGSRQEVVVTFKVGSMGIDEDGGIRLSFRFVSDMGVLQTVDPAGENYAVATTTGNARLEPVMEKKGNTRPFQRSLFVHVRDATLYEGDVITIRMGDRSAGGSGWRQQTYVEDPMPIRLSVDPLGTHDYVELPRDLYLGIIPGDAARAVLIAPSLAATGEGVELVLKAEDRWGNPLRDTATWDPSLRALRAGLETARLPGHHDRGIWRFIFTPPESGIYTFAVDSDLPSMANPMHVRNRADMPAEDMQWCDLHGQTGETVGCGTIDDYYHFARHFGCVAATTPQHNDFQITEASWRRIKDATDAAYEPGKFVTFKGYEWSGTTPMGGDHNVLYLEDDPPLYRSSGWLDGHPVEETAPISKLYDRLHDHEAMTIAHVGGRPASFTVSDPDVEQLVELHSAWGTFEWVFEECFARGFQVGFVCNSDGHKCRPGASYPGAGIFGTLGGLTCILAETRTREALWQAMRKRRCYGTTGQRILVDTTFNGNPIGADVDAAAGMIDLDVIGTAPVVQVDLFRKSTIIQTFRSPAPAPDTLVIRFGGARVRGRARIVKWRMAVSIRENELREAILHGNYNPEAGIRKQSRDSLEIEVVTSGNTMSLCLQFTKGMQGAIALSCEQCELSFDVNQPTSPNRLFEAPIDQRVEVYTCDSTALPDRVTTQFPLEIDHEAREPYFLRVTQIDEAKAWTSPFYIAGP